MQLEFYIKSFETHNLVSSKIEDFWLRIEYIKCFRTGVYYKYRVCTERAITMKWVFFVDDGFMEEGGDGSACEL